MSELKYCPFCGGEAEVAYSNDNHKQPYIRCKFGVMENPKCPASNMYQWQFRSLDEAIKSWNTRKPMANIVEKLEEELLTSESAHAEAVIGMCGVSASGYSGEISAYTKAINIVKQGINNGLE